jgi:hypothetical protein
MVRACRLADFAGIASIPGVQLFSLQLGHGAEQVLDPPVGMSVTDLTTWPEGFDFAETAAAIANLDAIVTVDTATAHLAGALGRPTYVLLSDLPYWTWMVDRDDSPWYPTVKLVRQTSHGEWQPVFEAVEREIRELSGAR